MVWAEVLLNEQELRDSISRCGGHRKAKTVLFVRFDCPVKQLSDFCTKLSVLWSSKGGLILATSVCQSYMYMHSHPAEHQKFLINVTISKVSDMFLQWWSMRNYILKYLKEI